MADSKVTTLTVIHVAGKILLGYKKRGFGVGRWNGFGGKIHPGESIEEGMVRELHEEAGIIANDYEKVGLLFFDIDNLDEIIEVHIFKINSFEGEPVETEEMKPRWFDFGMIPYADMWPDDKIWLPIVLSGQKVMGSLFFQDIDTIKSHDIKTVLELT